MDTRDRFIEVALQLFSEKGFYGASMDGIAREVGLTKQALIHHFGSKEKLYGAVLGRISEALLAERRTTGPVHGRSSLTTAMSFTGTLFSPPRVKFGAMRTSAAL